MITFYDDGPIQITSKAVRVDERTYPLTEFTRVWHQRGRRYWGVFVSRGALLMAIVGPLVAGVAGIVVALGTHTSPGVTIAIVGGSVLLGLAAGPVADLLLEHVDQTYTRGSRQVEIWAQWRGRPIRLLHTRDAMRFGRIYRALQRAMEQPATATPAPAIAATAARAAGQRVRSPSGPGPSGMVRRPDRASTVRPFGPPGTKGDEPGTNR